MFFFLEILISINYQLALPTYFVKIFLLLIMLVVLSRLSFHVSKKEKVIQVFENEKKVVSTNKVVLNNMVDLELQLKREKHDQKHLLNTIRYLIEEGNVEAVKELLDDTKLHVDKAKIVRYCENDIVNAVLTSYLSNSPEIQTSILIDIPKEFSISTYDITTLIGNIIENAVKNCQQSNHPKAPFIELRGGVRRSKFVLVCKNSCDENIQFKNDIPVNKSRKSYGVESVASLAEKYKGNVIYSTEDSVFTVNLILSL